MNHTPDPAHIGLIGLAVMGQNLARNIASRGYPVCVYNRTTEKTRAFEDQFGSENLWGEETLEVFLERLERPRKIILMIQAGKAVDAVIAELLPHLSKGDTVIDCGNSYYKDTIEREQKLAPQGVHYVGCGVSGGEEGALHGPSLMPGGSTESWEALKPIWESIAAKDFEGRPCVALMGADGAGHYVKMVHNGIEYAVMQMMAEVYDILRKGFAMSAPQIADVFEGFGKGRLESYLMEIVVPVLRHKDDEGDGYLIDSILDSAAQKGTGRWTAIESLDRGVVTSTITEAVNARVHSAHKVRRTYLASLYEGGELSWSEEKATVIPRLEAALHAAIIIAYAEGLDLIHTAAAEQNWAVDTGEVVRIWQGGCIIRAKLLKQIEAAYTGQGSRGEAQNLLGVESIVTSLKEQVPDLQYIVARSAQQGIPTPCLAGALSSFLTATSARTSANLIQGLRDFFGAHTYERTDRTGSFHTRWEEE